MLFYLDDATRHSEQAKDSPWCRWREKETSSRETIYVKGCNRSTNGKPRRKKSIPTGVRFIRKLPSLALENEEEKKEKRNSKNRKWISKVSENGRDYMRVVLKMAGHSRTGDRNKNIKSEMMNTDGVGVVEG